MSNAKVSQDPRERLRAAGLRVTAPRLAVIEIVQARSHVTADEVIAAARERLGSVSSQAIYDVLRILSDKGMLRRIEPAGSPARFESRTGDNHHHLVCRQCGEIRDVDCIVGHAPCMTPAESHGFVVDEAEVVFWGLCPRCQAVQAQAQHQGCAP